MAQKRSADAEVWEHHREELQALYLDQRRTLDEVRDLMSKKYDFCKRCVLKALGFWFFFFPYACLS
jgi:hypothetical protein